VIIKYPTILEARRYTLLREILMCSVTSCAEAGELAKILTHGKQYLQFYIKTDVLQLILT